MSHSQLSLLYPWNSPFLQVPCYPSFPILFVASFHSKLLLCLTSSWLGPGSLLFPTASLVSPSIPTVLHPLCLPRAPKSAGPTRSLSWNLHMPSQCDMPSHFMPCGNDSWKSKDASDFTSPTQSLDSYHHPQTSSSSILPSTTTTNQPVPKANVCKLFFTYAPLISKLSASPRDFTFTSFPRAASFSQSPPPAPHSKPVCSLAELLPWAPNGSVCCHSCPSTVSSAPSPEWSDLCFSHSAVSDSLRPRGL